MADVGLLALAKEYTNKKMTELIDIIYPVGSVYVSVNDVSPATLFGGTWVQIKDTFLLCAGDTYKGGTSGGEATVKLTTEHLPDVSSKITLTSGAVAAGTDFSRISSTGTDTAGLVKFTGGNKAHNNMPPYLVVYVYKRIS